MLTIGFRPVFTAFTHNQNSPYFRVALITNVKIHGATPIPLGTMMLAVGFLLFSPSLKNSTGIRLLSMVPTLKFRRVIIDIFPGFEVFAY